jgi:hypothetical protein
MDEHPARLSKELLGKFLSDATRKICAQIGTAAIIYRNVNGDHLAEDALGGCHPGQRFTRGVNVPWEVQPYIYYAEVVYRNDTGENLIYQNLGHIQVGDVLTFKAVSEDDFHVDL